MDGITLDELTTDIIDYFETWTENEVVYQYDFVANVDYSKNGPERIIGVTFNSGRYFQIVVSEP